MTGQDLQEVSRHIRAKSPHDHLDQLEEASTHKSANTQPRR